MSGPFKMKSAAHGGPMRRNFPSAFKDLGHEPEKPEGHTHSRKDPASMTGITGGEKNDKVIDESGEWVYQDARKDLVTKDEERDVATED